MFGKLLQAAVDVVSLPVDIVKDVVVGGDHTKEKIEKIEDEITDVAAGDP